MSLEIAGSDYSYSSSRQMSEDRLLNKWSFGHDHEWRLVQDIEKAGMAYINWLLSWTPRFHNARKYSGWQITRPRWNRVRYLTNTTDTWPSEIVDKLQLIVIILSFVVPHYKPSATLNTQTNTMQRFSPCFVGTN